MSTKDDTAEAVVVGISRNDWIKVISVIVGQSFLLAGLLFSMYTRLAVIETTQRTSSEAATSQLAMFREANGHQIESLKILFADLKAELREARSEIREIERNGIVRHSP